MTRKYRNRPIWTGRLARSVAGANRVTTAAQVPRVVLTTGSKIDQGRNRCVRTFQSMLKSVNDFDPVSAWAALLRTHAAVLPKVERALAPIGMPLTWYDVLLVVNAAPGRRLRMTELGQRAVVSRERVSRVVTELERAGLVAREANPDDKRSSFTVITPEGRRRLRASAPTYLKAIREHFLARLSDEETRVIAGALSRIVAAEEASTP
jgi:DNA-binding MarR family transcriptional regulator